jgi:hypothetical protein
MLVIDLWCAYLLFITTQLTWKQTKNRQFQGMLPNEGNSHA